MFSWVEHHFLPLWRIKPVARPACSLSFFLFRNQPPIDPFDRDKTVMYGQQTVARWDNCFCWRPTTTLSTPPFTHLPQPLRSEEVAPYWAAEWRGSQVRGSGAYRPATLHLKRRRFVNHEVSCFKMSWCCAATCNRYVHSHTHCRQPRGSFVIDAKKINARRQDSMKKKKFGLKVSPSLSLALERLEQKLVCECGKKN